MYRLATPEPEGQIPQPYFHGRLYLESSLALRVHVPNEYILRVGFRNMEFGQPLALPTKFSLAVLALNPLDPKPCS